MNAAMEKEARAKMEKYEKILENKKEYLDRPEIGYYLLVKNIKSEKNKQPFFKRMHERTRLCHPVYHKERKEEGYRETVKELLKYFTEKYDNYEELVQIYKRRRESAEMRIKQEAFKKEAEQMRKLLKKKEIERELSQIDFSKLTEVYKDLSQIDFRVYPDLAKFDDLAVL